MNVSEQEQLSPAAQRLRSIAGGRGWGLMAVMLSGPPLMALTFSTIAPVLPMIAQHFGAQEGGTLFAQWIMTAPAIGLMLGGPLAGVLIDKVGPRWLIIGAFTLFALAGSAGLWVDNPIGLLCSRFLLGLSGTSVATTATWLIGERFDELRRRRVIGIQDALAGVAAMSAVLLAGLAGAAGGWRLPFAIYLIAAPLVLIALIVVPAVFAGRGRRDTPPVTAVVASVWPVYAIVLSLAGLMMLPATQVPFLLEANGVTDPVTRSRVIASSAIVTIFSAALYSVLRQRLGERGTLALIILAYSLGTMVLSQSADAWGAVIGCMMLGFGTGLFSPHFASVLIARTPAPSRGRALGLLFGAIFLSEFLSPLVILPLRTAFGVHGGFLALGVALFVGFLVALFWKRAQS